MVSCLRMRRTGCHRTQLVSDAYNVSSECMGTLRTSPSTWRWTVRRPAFGAKPSDTLMHRATLRHSVNTTSGTGPASDVATLSIRRCHPQRLTSVSPRLHLLFNIASGAVENKHFISFPAQRILNHSLPFKLHLLCKCVNTTKCMCFSIFTTIFPKELASELATPLDPNTYAKLDRSSGTRWPICKQVCPSW